MPSDDRSHLEPSAAPSGAPTDDASLAPTDAASPMPFEGLVAPTPIDAAPPEQARWLAFAAIVVGGLLGGLIGYGVGDLLGRTTTWAAVGGFIGGVGGAIGVGVIASLTLRAMNEWNAVQHPEDKRR